ncbi:MAG: TnpV protein [Acutalibacteraceae bacterium]|nr:TnpV protein [Acutalibacteraceae bacterium]
MQGDYNLPNLILPEQPKVELGLYAQMRKNYLLNHHKIIYYNYLTSGTLTNHLSEVQQRALQMEETLMKQMSAQEGLTEELKAQDMMTWVRRMNNLRNRVQEIVKAEVIFN